MTPHQQNNRIGTQTIGPNYHFTGDGPLVETARGIHAMGSDILKISLCPQAYGMQVDRRMPLVDIVSGLPEFRAVLDLPFRTILCWAQPRIGPESRIFHPGDPDQWEATVYRQMYDLTAWLLRTYSGSGKTFLLGNWEGDWILLGGYDYTSDPSPEVLASLIRYFQVRQDAVEAARRDIPHDGVQVGHYIEVNRPLDALDLGQTRLANAVLPFVKTDMISYSAYDSLKPHRLEEALDYLEKQAQFTSYFDQCYERKVFVGEYDAYEDYHVNGYADPQRQVENTLRIIRSAIEWGAPFVLFWAFYNNESERLIHGGGFWLIDDNNQKQPVWHLHHQLLSDIQSWQESQLRELGSLPGNAGWRRFIRDWEPAKQLISVSTI